MNLKSLHAPQMVAVLRPWLDPAQERPLLESFDTVKPLLKKLDPVLTALLGQQVTGQGPSEALKALQTEESGVDGTHDRKLKGMALVLEGLSLLADQDAQRNAYAGALARLLPEGLSAIRQSYLTESGNAALAEGRLTIGDRGLLAATPLPHGLLSLEKQFQEYVAAGRQLGTLERQKLGLTAVPSGVTPAEVGRVRGSWIKLVNAVLINLSTETLTPAQEQRILGTLQQALLQVSTHSDVAAEPAPVVPAVVSSAGSAVTSPHPAVSPKATLRDDDEDEATVISHKP